MPNSCVGNFKKKGDQQQGTAFRAWILCIMNGKQTLSALLKLLIYSVSTMTRGIYNAGVYLHVFTDNSREQAFLARSGTESETGRFIFAQCNLMALKNCSNQLLETLLSQITSL